MSELIIAFDRTARFLDQDGRLHVEACNFSKANVCPYYGREIPDWQAHALDPDKVYYLLRDPAELAAAIETANGIPLLDDHIIVSVDDPKQDRVVGAMGTHAVFSPPYARNNLVVWVQESIDRIMSGEQRQLSAAYRYVAVMTPGTYEGLHFDGKMTSIAFNHVALVREGRAGPDVVVADHQPERLKMALSKKAIMVRGALTAVARPLMAADAKVDFSAALDGVTAKNFADRQAEISKAVQKAVKGKLIEGADVKAFDAALDAMKDEDCGEDEDMDAEDAAPDDDEDDKKAMDAAIKAAVAEALKAHKPAKSTPISAAAMDAAIKTAVDSAVKSADDRATKMANDAVSAALAKRDALDAARAAVRPLIGEVALDSAEAVYKAALDHAGVDITGVDPSAFPALVKMATQNQGRRIALDYAPTGGRADSDKLFPALSRFN